MIICIPTLICYDKCINLIKSIQNGTVQPEKIVILDNGSNFKNYCINNNEIDIVNNVNIYSFNTNIGVASSWNWFIKNLEGDLLILNDDIEFYENTLITFLTNKKKEEDSNTVVYTATSADNTYLNENFSFFMINSNIKNIIGYFDENFYPAYFEDDDYKYRIKLLNYSIKVILGVKYKHELSATFKRQQIFKVNQNHHNDFERNKQYYISKWGAEPKQEKYINPFNNINLTTKDWNKMWKIKN